MFGNLLEVDELEGDRGDRAGSLDPPALIQSFHWTGTVQIQRVSLQLGQVTGLGGDTDDDEKDRWERYMWPVSLNYSVLCKNQDICPYLQNAVCIFVDLSYSALMACNFCLGGVWVVRVLNDKIISNNTTKWAETFTVIFFWTNFILILILFGWIYKIFNQKYTLTIMAGDLLCE